MIEKTETTKINENISYKKLLKVKKKYKKSFLRTALLLCLYQIKHSILSSLADFIFSGKKQKTTKFLRFANKAVNKNICKCQRMAEKCEYYREKIESLNVG